ncbi:MAG TPA: phosphatase [Pseudoflavonifractor sp.]|nr:phosphatase [Pseudoflavonifractor sp.]
MVQKEHSMYGVIDIGSNTMRLSIYSTTESSFRLLLNKKSMAGLAGFIDKKGRLSEEGVKKAVYVLKSFQHILENIGVEDTFVFATASLRNASNADEVLQALRTHTGFEVDLISGEREALLDFMGATHLLPLEHGLLVDIGGGSTELAVYDRGCVEKAVSIPLGSLNLYTRFVKDILPTEKELEKIKEAVKSELKKISLPGGNRLICGVGGSIRCACKLCNDIYALPEDNRVIDGKRLHNLLWRMGDERKFAVKTILRTAPDRIHTILPGMTLLKLLADKFDCTEIQVSGYGVREGYLCSKLFGGEQHAGGNHAGTTCGE